MNDNESKHLEFIQSAINRMANNSFLLKGWSVTLSAALLAMVANSATLQIIFVAAIPPLVFWGLDAYYLRQERLFRRLYDDVRVSRLSEKNMFLMSTAKFNKQVPSWFLTLWSPTVFWFHGMLVLIIFIAIIVLYLMK